MLEYCDRGTLKRLILDDMIRPHRSLYSLSDALRWSHELSEALAYLHDHSPDRSIVLHRDLKSENVLLTMGSDGLVHAKLADFGLCKLVHPEEVGEETVKLPCIAITCVDLAMLPNVHSLQGRL